MKLHKKDESETSQNGSLDDDDYPTIKPMALFNSNVKINIL
jgi:hypothetical protein